MLIMASTLALPAAAQYQDVLLPQGVLQVTVEDQPINAVTSPVINVVNPRIAGSLATGGITIELAVADASGAVIRFPTEVNARGVFRQRPPEPLQPGGQYTLYINDAMVGQFTISPDATGGGSGTTNLELARLVAFPQDTGGAIPGLGLVPELSQYQSLAEVARIIAQSSENNTQEARQQARSDLTAAGFVQRYQSSLAVPSADDPTVFEIQIVTVVSEYASAEAAEAGFAASIASSEAIESTPIGDESHVSSLSAVATQTGTEYQAVQLIFRQDRLLFVINFADLLNRPPDQAVLEAMGQAILERTAPVLAGEAPALTQKGQQMSTTGVPRSSIEQYYEAINGAIVPLFGETEQSFSARGNAYSGGTDVGVTSVISRGAGENQEPVPDQATTAPFTYTTSLVNFPSAEDATAWMNGLAERLAADPLPTYLSMSQVADAPTYGEASATYRFTQQLEGQTASGFRTYVQVGAEVAIVELAAVPEAPMAVLEPLIQGQVQCLTEGNCAAVADPPTGLPAAGAAPSADAPADAPADATTETDASTEPPATEEEPSSDLPAGMEREPAATEETE
jgi:hypothetical protein